MKINFKKLFFPAVCLITGLLQIIMLCANYMEFYLSYGKDSVDYGFSGFDMFDLAEQLGNNLWQSAEIEAVSVFFCILISAVFIFSLVLVVVGGLGVSLQLLSKWDESKDAVKAPRRWMLANTIYQVISFLFYLLICLATTEGYGDYKTGLRPGFGAVAIAIIALAATIGARIAYAYIPESKPAATFKCDKCGADVTAGAKFCPACGAEVTAPSVRVCPKCGKTAEEGQAFCPDCGVEFVAQAAGTAVAAISFADIMAKIKKFIADKNISTKTLKTVGIAVVGVIALIIIISIIPWGQASQYVEMENDMFLYYDQEDDSTVIIAKGEKTDLSFDGSYKGADVSADGSVMAVISEDGDLYICDGKKLEKIDNDVTSVKMSCNGEGAAYLNDDGELYLLNVKKGDSELMTDELVFAGMNAFVISPDGKTVAYTEGETDDFALYTNNSKGKSDKIADDFAPIGISDDAKLIYYYDVEDDKIIVQSKKDEIVLAKNVSAYMQYSSFSYTFNADHTQIIFQLEDKSYISINGGEKEKIGAYVSQIGNEYMANNGTSKVLDFTEQYVLDYKGDLFYINKKGEIEEMASDVDEIRLTDSGDVIYILDDSEILYRCKGNGKDVNKNLKKVAFNVEEFVIDSEGERCYYTDYSDDLYSVKKTGKAKKITSEIEQLTMTADDIALFIANEDSLYYSSNGGKAKKITDEVSEILANDIAAYYITEDSGEYEMFGTDSKTKFDLIVKYEMNY